RRRSQARHDSETSALCSRRRRADSCSAHTGHTHLPAQNKATRAIAETSSRVLRASRTAWRRPALRADWQTRYRAADLPESEPRHTSPAFLRLTAGSRSSPATRCLLPRSSGLQHLPETGSAGRRASIPIRAVAQAAGDCSIGSSANMCEISIESPPETCNPAAYRIPPSLNCGLLIPRTSLGDAAPHKGFRFIPNRRPPLAARPLAEDGAGTLPNGAKLPSV